MNINKKIFKNLLILTLIFYINEYSLPIIYNTNIFFFKILYIFFYINKLIEFPLIFITYIIIICIYIRSYNIKNIIYIIFISASILLISLTIKKIIKNNIFIKRPYNFFFIKKKIYKNNINKKKIYIPKWLIKQWKEKKNSSFPSGHTLFTSYWIIKLWKKKRKTINNIIIFFLIILTLNRIWLLLHRSNELIFSFILNIILINIINKIFKYIKKKIKF